MRKLSVLFAGTLLLAIFCSVTAFKPLPPGPSANGQGGLTIGDRVQHFSFHASTDKAGVVSGSFEVKSPSQDL
ncbi:MAG: hypothetical protein H7296_06920 [Bacteroidia bacterium]|nr:hypothetical protein [Bacteroidia bacterium]